MNLLQIDAGRSVY